MRLRLWNDPATWTNYSNEADVTRSIERSKRAGMQVLLDFHYSDDWADPQKQTIPAAWAADIDDPDKLATHVYEYTRDVLARLNARGLMPYMVQVGNEINTQMLRPAETKGDAHRLGAQRQNTECGHSRRARGASCRMAHRRK